MSTATRPRQHEEVVPETPLRTGWDNLPMLMIGAVPPVLAWAAVRLGTGSIGPAWVLGTGLLVLPAFAPLLTGCLVLRTADHFGPVQLVRCVPRVVRTTVGLTAVPTVVAALTLVSLSLWSTTGRLWMLVPVGVGATLTVLAAYVGVVALPHALRRRTPVLRSWTVAFFLAARHPVRVLAVLCAAGIAGWGVERLGNAFSLLVPGPLALVWAAATTVAGHRLDARPRPTPTHSAPTSSISISTRPTRKASL